MSYSLATPEDKADPTKGALSLKRMRPGDFRKICEIVYQYSGIRLNAGKEELVRSRLMKRLRTLGISDFASYIRHVYSDRTAQELRTLIDCLTTNKTLFFREKHHFEYLQSRILPELRRSGTGLRIWSAGCSSGEEPYSIAMLLHDQWSEDRSMDVRILATDISHQMLARARAGEYERDALGEIPTAYLAKYLSPAGKDIEKTYRVRDRIRKLVRFARLNLMDEWPMKGPFNIIFCRNVMIYFDTSTQQRLVQRFYKLVAPGGYFFVGHSESLLANAGGFRYIRPSIYRKV